MIRSNRSHRTGSDHAGASRLRQPANNLRDQRQPIGDGPEPGAIQRADSPAHAGHLSSESDGLEREPDTGGLRQISRGLQPARRLYQCQLHDTQYRCRHHDRHRHHVRANIFWNNTNYGIFLGNSGAVLSHNDYGTQGGATPATDVGNLSVNPQFIDAAGGDFHLAANSPLLGYGTPQGTITDLDGNPYPLKGKIDLGAYTETIFTDGFEP